MSDCTSLLVDMGQESMGMENVPVTSLDELGGSDDSMPAEELEP